MLRARSLRSRVALLMGVAGVLLGVVATGIIEWRVERSTLFAQQRSLELVANEASNRLNADLQSRRREVVLAAGLLEKSGLNQPADVRALLETLKSGQPSYAWLGLTDAQGKVVAATSGMLEGVNVSQRPWFDGAQREKVFLGDPHEAKLLAGLVAVPEGEGPVRFVDVSVRLLHPDGTLRGVLGAHLHWRWARRVIDKLRLDLASPPSIDLYVVDRSGNVLLPPQGLAASTAPPPADPAFLAARSGAEIDQASALGWSVLARQPLRAAMAPIYELRMLALALAAAIGAAFMGLTWWMSKRAVQPITSFAEAVQRFDVEGTAPFAAATASRSDELGALARTMGGLVERFRILAGRNRLFIEHAPVPLAVFDTDMRYLTASHRWLSDYGIEGERVFGRSHYEIFPEISEAWREFHRRALAGETLRSERDRFERSNRPTQWIRWEIRPWYLPDGTIGGIAIFSEEITARVEAERAQRVSEERFRATFEQAAVGIAHTAIDGRLLLVNDRLCNIVGYTREDLQGMTFQEITHPDDLQPDLARMKALLAGEIRHYQIDKRYRRKAGDFVWATLTVAVVRGPDGLPDYLVSVVEDISERKHLQQQMDEHRANLEQIVAARTRDLVEASRRIEQTELAMDHAGIGIHWIDVESGRFTYVNPCAARMLGYSVDEMLALRISDIDPNRPESTREEMTRLLRAQGTASFESVNRAKDGTLVPIEVLVHFREATAESRAHFIGFVTDISARRAAQSALQQAKADAEAAGAAKSEFLANMSHEIRTPLNGVLGMAQVGYRDSPPGSKGQAAFGRILESGRLLLTVINDILDFSKIEAGKLDIESVALDPGDIVETAVSDARVLAEGKPVVVACEQSGLPRSCLGDPMRITQVLLNLLSNAVKFTPAGEVRLAARRAGADLEFVVSDTGVGIAADQLERLFEPFNQADSSTTRRFGGTGLGLTISRRLAQLMRGSLEAVSVPGQGSTFTLRVPCLETADTVTRPPASPGEPGRRLAGLRLLVAEDNPVNQVVLESLLGDEGALTVNVSSGSAAVRAAEEEGATFDAVLMDVQMPEMDGLEAARRVKQLRPDLPIIGQTAHAMKEEHDRCIAAGMSAVVSKPLEIEKLVAVLIEHVRAKRPEAQGT